MSSYEDDPSRSSAVAGAPGRSRRTGRIVLGALLVWFALVLATLLILGVAFTLSSPHAKPSPDGDRVVAPNEVLDETLFAAAKTVRIHGTVEGDAVVSARHVQVTGTIHGNLDVVAESVEIEVSGTVDGALHCVCQELTIGGLVGQNVYAAGDTIVLAPGGDIHRDAIVAGTDVRALGSIGRDAWFFARELEADGQIGRDLRGMVGVATLLPGAAIGDDLELRVRDAELVSVGEGASIGGRTAIHESPEFGGSKYRDPAFYLAQVLQLFGAFIVGLVAFRWFPALLGVKLDGTGGVLRSMGIGLLVLLVIPVVSLFSMMTLVGFPVGVILAGAYALALYMAGIVVAGYLGPALLSRDRDSLPLSLFVGLSVVVVATELPLLGGLIGWLVIILGLGILFRAIEARVQRWRASSSS